ncbi:MAG: proprotein convertase P-domain-containing protein [Bacteroidetes bacterium]|nr:proprotein convertase P-domain-containing protein [Bacteroidota bacterium]
MAVLFMCCFSHQTLLAQCNIAYTSSASINLSLGFTGTVTLNSNVFIPYVSSPNCPGGTIEIWTDGTATIPFPPTNYNCADEGLMVTVWVTIEDPFSQSNAIPFVVTIVDDVPPLVAFPADVTVSSDPNTCAAVVSTLTPVVTDNCPSSVSTTWIRTGATGGSGSNSANGTYNVGVTSVMFTVTDGANTVTHTTVVTVNDNQPPSFTSPLPTNAVASANASCEYTHFWTHPSVTDNCGLMFPPTLTYTITYTGATPGGPFAVPVAGGATSKVFELGVTTCTYAIDDDGAGPHVPVTYAFTVTVNDNTPPSFGAAPTVMTAGTVTCVAPITLVRTATDNCDPSPDLSFVVVTVTGGPSPFTGTQSGGDASGDYPVGVYNITFSAFDGVNTQTHTVNLTVTDNIDPVAACQDITVSLDGNGEVTVDGIDLDDGSTDNCAVTAWQIRPDPPGVSPWFNSMDFDCFDLGANPVEFRVLDAGGNDSGTCFATITVIDDLPPVAQCQDITVDLVTGGVPVVTVLATQINNGSTDNCTDPLTDFSIRKGTSGAFLTSIDFNCPEVGDNLVELRVRDALLNENFCTAIVKVRDVTDPVAIAAPYAAVLSSTPGAGSVLVTPANINSGSTDDCGIVKYEISRTSSTTGFSETGVTFTCADLIGNPHTVWLRVMDEGDGTTGNSDVISTTVTVSDATAPTAVCQPAVLQLNNSGIGILTPAMVDGGSFDNCSFSLSVTPSVFDCSDIASNPNMVTLTATDGSGNMHSCMTTVTVEDNVPPVATCQFLNVALQSNGEVEVFAIQVSFLSYDVCCGFFLPSLISVNGSPYAPSYNFDCSEVGTNAVSVQVFDCNGNSSICTAGITIQDNEDPVITCPADITIECDDDDSPTNTGSATAIDNCPTPTVGWSDFIDPLSNVCVGTYIITRTWEAEDNYGNTSTCVQTINVEDTTIPSFTAPADAVVDCPDSYTVANHDCNSFPASAGLPLTISPVGTAVYNAFLFVNVPFNGKIMDIDVTDLVIHHTYIGDLTVRLISPSGDSITLSDFDILCENHDDIDINFDDEAVTGTYPCPPNTGLTYDPTTPLSEFDGEFMNGWWTLQIIDGANFDGGALISWNLDICYVTQPGDTTHTGYAIGVDDNCDTPVAEFSDSHAYKDFASHAEGGAYNFSIGQWTYSEEVANVPSSTDAFIEFFAPDSIRITGSNDGQDNTEANFCITVPEDGFIAFDWDFHSFNTHAGYDPFGYQINGSFTQLTDGAYNTANGATLQDGRALVPVLMGQVFCFSQLSSDGILNPARTAITNFLFSDYGMPVPIDGCERKFCIARLWDLEDDCGNAAATQLQIVGTRDITPADVTFPNTMTVLAQNGICSPLVNLDLSTFISDACSEYADLTISNDADTQYGTGNGTDDASGFYAPGNYDIDFTIVDECGNTTIHNVALEVIDAQDPTAVCIPNITVQLDNNGMATLTAANVDNGSTDNCAIVNMTLSQTTFDINDIGEVPVTLTTEDAAGNTNSCISIILVLGGVIFDAGDAAGPQGSTVLVPVTVMNFEDIISFEFDMDITDGTVATVNTVEGINAALPGLLFTTSPTSVHVSWFGGATTLADGATAFSVRVNLVGTTGSSTPILISNDEVGQMTMGGPAIVPSLGLAGTISVVDPNSQFSIEGTLLTEIACGSGPVHLVDVDYYGSVNGTVSNAPGAYAITVPSGTNITIEPDKNINWNNGVTTLDALCVHYYSVGLPLPGSCPPAFTPYQKIAADANANDVVTVFDAAIIQQIALFNTPAPNNESWRFVPALPVLPADPFALGFDETLSYVNVTGDILDADFIGIKTGDINCSANPVTAFGNVVTDDRGQKLIFRVADAAVEANQDVFVTFKATDFNGIFSVQTTFNYDQSVLEFVGATTSGLNGMMFNTQFTAEGKLAASWYNLNALSVAEGTELFTLHFKTKGSGILSQLLSSSSDLVVSEVATAQGNVIGVDLVFESFTATSDTPTGYFALYQNRPNPFSFKTAIGFTLPESSYATLKITDAAGKTLKVVQGQYAAGYHQIMVDRKDLPASGVLFYHLETADHQAVKKMILVD